jgi:glycerophosphoryl diester phosphodiesterase
LNIPPRTLLLTFCLLAAGKHAVTAESPELLIVAHRGLLRHAPEDTLANFRACLELRLGFEFDVQRTKDGALVCIHDNTVDRTTNGSGEVAKMMLAEIRRLDAGSWFGPKFAGEKVPTVEEVFALLGQHREHDVLVAVDLKAENVEQDVVRLAEKYDVLDRLLFIGRTISEPPVRAALRKASPKAQTAALANNAGEFAEALAAEDAGWVYVRFLPSECQMAAVHRSKKRAFIAGVMVSGDLPDNWRRALDVGIDAILTDFPLKLRTLVREESPDE